MFLECIIKIVWQNFKRSIAYKEIDFFYSFDILLIINIQSLNIQSDVLHVTKYAYIIYIGFVLIK